MKYKSTFKQRNKTIQGLRLFKDTLPTKAKKIITKKGEIYSKTLDNWKYLVGDILFKTCYPKSYRKTLSKGKLLTIMVKHGNEVNLEYSKQNIIDKMKVKPNNEPPSLLKLIQSLLKEKSTNLGIAILSKTNTQEVINTPNIAKAI